MSESKKYIVSARKYRPATFRSVVGQKSLTATLKNAILTNRLAQAYLFCGPRGVGKTSCARIFAKTINCLHPTPDGEACGECEMCRAIEEGNSFNITELDAASNNSVDYIRNLTDQVSQRPQGGGRYRVFIIDEVHMLSSQAFNAFLKTLEEPPSYVIFILATTEKHKVIPTILSRCQIYDFKRITIQDMVEHLQYVAEQENISTEPSALGVIARKADGAMRDALSIFDQVAASSESNVTYQSTIANLNVLDHEFYFQLVNAFHDGDIPGSLLLFADIRNRGFDPQFFINGLAGHIRDLMMAADPRTLPLLEEADDVAKRFAEQAATLPLQWYYAAIKILSEADVNYRSSGNKQLLVELSLIRLCQLLNPPAPPFDRVEGDTPLRDPIAAPYSPPRSAEPRQPQQQPQQSAAPQQPQPQQQPQQSAAPQQPQPQRQPPQQQTAVSQQPQPQTIAPQPGAAPRRRTARRTGTLRITDTLAGDGSGEVTGAGTIDRRREPVTPEAFSEAWYTFVSRHPEKHILCSAMRTGTPRQEDPETYSFTVGHPSQAQSFESDMPQLLEFLRNALRNDALTLTIKIDPTKAPDKTLPPQEFLKKVIETNPAMGEVLASLDAELA